MSFAGVSLTLIVLAAIFVALVALGLTGFRRALVAAVIAFYPATLIYQNFPWYTAQTASAAIALWAGCFLVCFWALRHRVDPAPWPRLGRFGAAIALAIAAFAQFLTLYTMVLPLDSFFALPEAVGSLANFGGVALALPILLAILRLI